MRDTVVPDWSTGAGVAVAGADEVAGLTAATLVDGSGHWLRSWRLSWARNVTAARRRRDGRAAALYYHFVRSASEDSSWALRTSGGAPLAEACVDGVGDLVLHGHN
jgi:hypothetical protein